MSSVIINDVIIAMGTSRMYAVTSLLLAKQTTGGNLVSRAL